MLSFNPIVDQPYTLHELPPLASSCHIIPHNLLSDEHVWAHPCCLTPLHRRRTGGSRGVTYRGVRFDLGGVSPSRLLRQQWSLVHFIFIFYFIIRLPLCNKYSGVIVRFISIHSVIIYVVFFGACMRGTWLCPLNPGVTEVVSQEMLTVGWNLDRNGQTLHSYLTLILLNLS